MQQVIFIFFFQIIRILFVIFFGIHTMFILSKEHIRNVLFYVFQKKGSRPSSQ